MHPFEDLFPMAKWRVRLPCQLFITCSGAENNFSSGNTGVPELFSYLAELPLEPLTVKPPRQSPPFPHTVKPQFVGWWTFTSRTVRGVIATLVPCAFILCKSTWTPELPLAHLTESQCFWLVWTLNQPLDWNLSCPSGSSEPSSFLFQKFPNQILTSLPWIQHLHAPHKIFRQKHDLSSSCGQQQFGQARMLFQCQKHGMPHGFHGPSHVPLFSDLAALQLRVPGQSLQAPYGRIFFGDLVQLPLALLLLKLKGKEQMKRRFPDRVLWISNRNHMIRWQSCKRLVWGNHDVVFRMFLHFARWRMKQK